MILFVSLIGFGMKTGNKGMILMKRGNISSNAVALAASDGNRKKDVQQTPSQVNNANLCSTIMTKFRFPYPKRGIGRVTFDEDSLPSVWKFFQYNPVSDRSQCNFCGYLLAGKNCTNLRVHLKTRHYEVFDMDYASGS